ncbi:MAG: transposase, partial [Cryobacterium sp.]|nr:transposase [Cryobacterium sp.]
KRSDLAGWAEYGYCASHSRFFWGLRLHLVCTLQGLPVGWSLSGAKADEREILNAILESTPALGQRAGRQVVIADKAYYGRDFEAGLDAAGIELLRPARKGEKPRPGQRFFKPLRQVIESINATFKGQLDLERHGAKTPAGVCARIAQRVLALTAAIWHNDNLGLTIRRSLTATTTETPWNLSSSRNTVQLGHYRFFGRAVGLGPAAVTGSLDVPAGVLAFDDAGVGPRPSLR